VTRRLAILALLVFAAALRVHGIGRESLWFDESATWQVIRHPLPEMFRAIVDAERTPPLHYVILHFWRMIFGDAEWSLRLPSAIAGTAAVFVLLRIGEKLSGFRAGLIAALTLAVSHYQILYSQEARAYSLMLLLGLLSVDIFLRLLDQPTRRREVAYVIVTALLLYTHLHGVFIIVVEWIVFLAARERKLRLPRWLILQLAIVALFAPWIPIAIRWTHTLPISAFPPPANLDDIAASYRLYCGSTAMVLVLVALAVFSWHGFSTRAKQNPRVKNSCHAILAISLMLVPVVLPIVIFHRFTDRYAIVAPAGLYLAAACGIARIRWRTIQCLLVISLAAMSYRDGANDWRKPDWRGAGEYLNRCMRPTDVAAVNRRLSRYLYDYYVHRPDVPRKAFDGDAIQLGLPLPADQHVWLVLANETNPPRDILARGNWHVISQRKFYEVIVLELSDK
jgi:mannosyltransferase